MPVDLSSLLSDTLTDQGYQVEDAPSPIEGRSGASYPVSLIATRDGDRYLVDVLASRTVRDEDVSALDAIVDDTGLDGALVLALEGTDLTPEIPQAETVDVWDREQVDRAVGRRVLDGIVAGDVDPDEIGPTPTDVDQPASEPDTADTQTAPASTGTAEPETSTGTPGSPPSQPTTDPTPAQQPDRAEPDPEPEPAAADTSTEPTATADDDDGAFEGTGVDQREFLDPEDMLERAEELSQKGEIDDGDAELIVEDDDPSGQPEPDRGQPAPGAQSTPDEPGQADPDPGAGSTPDPTEVEPADDGSDAELLDSGSTATPTDSRPGPDAEPPEPETASTARAEPTSEPDDTPGSATPTEATEEPAASASSPAAAAGPRTDDESFLSGATIEPQLDEADARRKAEEVVLEAKDARLELLPFRVYRYQALLEGDGHSENEEGEVWVSTQSGAVVDAPDGDRVDDPEVACERFQGSLSRSETRDAARGHLLDSLERRDEVRQEYSESAVIERVELTPDPDSITFEDRGKAYAPRWRVDGPNQTVFVDAVTGELVKG